jgi:hypothetical protein
MSSSASEDDVLPDLFVACRWSAQTEMG